MAKILFISNRNEKISQYRDLFKMHEFSSASDISDFVEVPDVIIFDYALPNVKDIVKKLKSAVTSTAFVLLTQNGEIEHDLVKNINSFITEDMSESLILSTINVNLKTKSSLEQLSETNKNLADSLYRLNVLYSTSSQFAGTLDKALLVDYMIEGLDKSLSFDLTCTLAFLYGRRTCFNA